MPAYIYVGGCKVLVENPSSDRALDICNCSAYYYSEGCGLQKERRFCPPNELWNYKLGGCESEDKVLSQRLCNRKSPWERCSEDTHAAKKRQIKSRCIAENKYSETIGAQYNDKQPFKSAAALPSDVTLSNLELAAAAFVAGCVITLFLLAIIFTMCELPSSFSKKFKTVKSKKKVTKTKKKRKEVITEGDNVSIQYEDIDEEHTEQGYRPMFTGAHLQLQGDSFQNTDGQRRTEITSVTVTASSNTRSSKPSPPPKAPPLPPSNNKPSWIAAPQRPLPAVKSPPQSNTGLRISMETKEKRPMKIPPRPVASQKTSIEYLHPH